jgi:hypothetical protein
MNIKIAQSLEQRLNKKFDNEESNAVGLVKDLSIVAGEEAKYFGNLLLGYTGNATDQNSLYCYVIDKMQAEEDITLKAKGYLLQLGFNKVAAIEVFEDKKGLVVIPPSLVHQYDFNSASEARKKLTLKKIPAEETELPIDIYIATEVKLHKEEIDAFTNIRILGVRKPGCNNPENALYAGYRDGPSDLYFDSSH